MVVANSVVGRLFGVIKSIYRNYAVRPVRRLLATLGLLVYADAAIKRLRRAPTVNTVYLRLGAVLISGTVLAVTGIPTLFSNQLQIEQDRTIVLDELRVVRVDDESELSSAVSRTDTITSIGMEGIRDRDHLDELFTHFNGRYVLVEAESVDGRSSGVRAVIDSSTARGIVLNDAVVSKYTVAAPAVGAVVAVQLISAVPALTTSYLFSGESSITNAMLAYPATSLQFLVPLFIILLTVLTLVWTLPRMAYHALLRRSGPKQEHYRGE